MSSSCEEPDLIAEIAAVASHKNRTRRPVHKWPHVAAATQIAISSRNGTDARSPRAARCRTHAGHGKENHVRPARPPQPQLDDASVLTSKSGGGARSEL